MTGIEPKVAFALSLRREQLRKRAAIAATCLMMIAVVLASLGLGVVNIGPGQVLRTLVSPFLPFGWTADVTPLHTEIIQDLRLPRALMAIIAGAGLAISGTAMQGITCNVLVSPFTVGISPAAAFGASVAILSGLGAAHGTGPYWIVACAFASAISCAGLVLILSTLRGVTSTMLILCGVALTYLFGALTATVQFISTEQQLAAIVHWTFGSLNGSTWDEVRISGSALIFTVPVLLMHASALNAFAGGGDEVAASLGFAVARTRLIVTLSAAFLTASIVSFVGVIGFVGLVAPHIARMMIGGNHKSLLGFSAILGALLLLVADLIGRLAFAPVIIPVGIVVAYIGVPIFLQLLLTRRQDWSE